MKTTIHIESYAQIIQQHEQGIGQCAQGHPLCIIFSELHECSIQESVEIEKTSIVTKDDGAKNRHQEQAETPTSVFSNPKLHPPQKLARIGIWGLMWWVILRVTSFCESIAGTIEFSQLAGQGLVIFWRLLGM